jgi:hypothetical protein
MEVTMRRLTTLVAFALVFAVAATVTAKPSKPAAGPTMSKGQAPKGSPPKGPNGAPAKSSIGKSVKPAKTDAKIMKTDAKIPKASAKLAKSDARAAKGDTRTAKLEPTKKKSTDASSTKSTSTSGAKSGRSTRAGSSSSASTSTPTVDFTTTALGQKLQKNSALRSKIEAKLAAAGYTGTVYEAAYGFKNLGQLNAATNQVQNHGYSFDLLKVQMTGMYVDPQTHAVYRANRLPDGTVNLVSPELATNPVSTGSLGQSKQAIAAGTEMPKVVPVTTASTSTTKR